MTQETKKEIFVFFSLGHLYGWTDRVKIEYSTNQEKDTKIMYYGTHFLNGAKGSGDDKIKKRANELLFPSFFINKKEDLSKFWSR